MRFLIKIVSSKNVAAMKVDLFPNFKERERVNDFPEDQIKDSKLKQYERNIL